MNPKVDKFVERSKPWQKEVELLRKIALDCGLDEDLKWGQACYSLNDANVVLIHCFKEYCAYLFFKGALMSNSDGLLVQQTKNVQSARQIRFTDAKEITKLRPKLKAHIYEAIEVEKAGLKVAFKKVDDFAIADEFNVKLKEVRGLKKAFDALTPGRQKAYLLFFSSAKQAKTREARVEKYIPQILDGKGMDD